MLLFKQVIIIKIHRKLLPASKCSEIEDTQKSKRFLVSLRNLRFQRDFWHVRNVPFQTDTGLTEFSFDSRFLGHKENLVFRCAKNAEHF